MNELVVRGPLRVYEPIAKPTPPPQPPQPPVHR